MADLRHNSDIRRLKGVTEKDIKRIAKYHNMWVEFKAALDAWDTKETSIRVIKGDFNEWD